MRVCKKIKGKCVCVLVNRTCRKGFFTAGIKTRFSSAEIDKNEGREKTGIKKCALLFLSEKHAQ